MTAILFRILGALAFLAGCAWSFLILAAPGGGPGAASAGFALGKLLAAAPGLGLAFSGLMLLAIGEALWQLDRIARHAAKIVHNTADIADALDPPKPRKDAATNFGDAVQLFQANTGKSEPGAAIRDLATDALRQKGYLQ